MLGAPWSWIFDGIATALGRDGIVAGDSAMVCYRGAVAALPAYHPAAFLYPTGYGTLGYGLPAAIGAKVGRPEARVIALLGDGGIMFTVAELAAAAQLRLPLPVVVVDNAGYGEIRNEMAERGDPVHAVDLDVTRLRGAWPRARLRGRGRRRPGRPRRGARAGLRGRPPDRAPPARGRRTPLR